MLYRIILYVIFVLVLILGFSFFTAQVTAPATAEAKTIEVPIKKIDRLFEKIAWCESKGDLHAKNPGSSASGEFQFVSASWFHYGKELWGEDFYTKNIWSTDNRELAEYVYKKYGTRDWNASKDCWGN